MPPGPATHRVLEEVYALERELQTPLCRADPGRLQELLDPEFVEIGASGRRWDLAAVITMLAEEQAEPDLPPIEVTELDGRVLASGLVQVFWISTRGERRARRTSIWRERNDRWQLTYHQGTPLP